MDHTVIHGDLNQEQLSALPSIADRLRKLRPSQELLDFYRQKIAEFDGEHADMLTKLERYKATFEDQHKLDWQVARREEEIGELQKALSDMQLYLFQEREHVLRLYAENDRLKIQEVEDRKKIQSLLGLTQPVEHETTYFQAPGEARIVGAGGKAAAVAARVKKEKQAAAAARREGGPAAGDGAADQDKQVLLLTIEALKAQMQDQLRLAKDQVQALIDDRRVREEEAKMTREQEAEKNRALVDRLHNTQNLLYDSTRDLLELKYEHRQRERAFSEEKESLLQRVEELKDDIDSFRAAARPVPPVAQKPVEAEKEFREMGTNAYRPGGRPDVDAEEESTRRDATRGTDAESSVGGPKDHVQESLADMYREQAIALEDELCRLREEKEAAKGLQTDKADKMGKRAKLWQKRFQQLEQRRSLEVQGYKTDIKLLRKRLRELERQLYRLAVHMGENDPEMQMLGDVRKTAVRSRKAVQELQQLKAKMYHMEHDVRRLQDNGVDVAGLGAALGRSR